LAFVDPRGNTAKVLATFAAVSTCDSEDEAAIRSAIADWLANLESSRLMEALRANQQSVRAYSRAAQADALAGICAEIAAS
jgi:hypothetical protein